MPFNSLGSVNTPDKCFDYIDYTKDKRSDYDYVYVNDVVVTKTDARLTNATNSLNRNVYSAFVDFELIQNRYPRQS
jgi:hypothetical protein